MGAGNLLSGTMRPIVIANAETDFSHATSRVALSPGAKDSLEPERLHSSKHDDLYLVTGFLAA
jgi:hypothetical protein